MGIKSDQKGGKEDVQCALYIIDDRVGLFIFRLSLFIAFCHWRCCNGTVINYSQEIQLLTIFKLLNVFNSSKLCSFMILPFVDS